MEAEYYLTIDEFISYCEKNQNQFERVDGHCRGCPDRKKCISDRKLCVIDGIFRMKEEDSRFPGLLRLLRKTPSLPYLIPAYIYEKIYGRYNDTFQCFFCSREIVDHLPEIRQVYDLLTNEVSKATFLNVLMYRLTFNRDYLYRAYSMFPQYLIPPYQSLGSETVYVDCGAYTGDSFECYCRYNEAPTAAYLFEPDDKNREAMIRSLKLYQEKTELRIIDKGVYDTSGKVFFSFGKGGQSHISKVEQDDCIELDVVAIDDAIDRDVSFIKMDIEGSEKAALLGAKEHILRSYPKLAICVYHGISDLWEIPLMVSRMFPKYNHFELRHHDRSVSETVLYAYCSTFEQGSGQSQ